ncbi:unnamed protein product [Paramecium sonneborni]|uniref:Uncharacterized protein n=1 Tax=Paramecium sonneborni TaxID=65129 RepID=A0A8S1KFL4_9CILI|nr:unnamed protein product [Paramecium sonneborni]
MIFVQEQQNLYDKKVHGIQKFIIIKNFINDIISQVSILEKKVLYLQEMRFRIRTRRYEKINKSQIIQILYLDFSNKQ